MKKLVRESLYNFQKTGDVKGGLNIGIRSKISDWLDQMMVENYTINDDLSIDVDGPVNLYDRDLTEFPPFIKFRKVKEYFECSMNHLTSLRGAPDEVGGSFNCSNNELTNLKGAPSKVTWSFNCYGNKLTTLDGSPHEVGWNFTCHDNSKRFTEEEIRAVCNVKGQITT